MHQTRARDGKSGGKARNNKPILLLLSDLIPAFVRARGEKALAAYHGAIESGGSTYDKPVKVLLVGQASAKLLEVNLLI